MSQSPTRSWSPGLSLNMPDPAQLHSSLPTEGEEKSPGAERDHRFIYSPQTTKEGETMLVVFKDAATCAVAVLNPREVEEGGGKNIGAEAEKEDTSVIKEMPTRRRGGKG